MKTRVLIVDDEKQFTDQLGERLLLRDFSVFTAYSGETAIDMVEKENYDVIILDVKMPGMDGVKALRELKSRKPLIEVIMLTGHATVESAIEGMKLGAFDYLLKPTDTDDLVSKVKAAKKKKAEHEERIRQAKVREIVSSPKSVLKED